MDQFEIYIALLGITVVVGMLFKKSIIPIPFFLVITGMLLSLLPQMPRITLNPSLVLDIFLPMLVYTASAEFSWREIKNNMRPILILSIGHVFFITFVVALVLHQLLPELGWAKSIVLGAIVSPPDDVTILAIAEKIRLPSRVMAILTGESLFNDATALTLFRFALAADLTHQFSAVTITSAFFLVVIGESLYGLLLGHLIGKLRMRMEDPILQMIVSVLTPFIAYLPAERLGGSGVLATVVTGFVIGNRYLDHFSPEARLTARALWKTLAFSLQSLLFLLVGLDLHYTLQGISSIPTKLLIQCSVLVILTIILGRFFWVYLGSYLPRFLFPSIRKRDPYPSWKIPFLVSWTGMRGGISLAAVLAIPVLPLVNGNDPRDFLIFLVFAVIIATLLVQGMTLPWLLKFLGIDQYGLREQYSEHMNELEAKKEITKAALKWLRTYKNEIRDNKSLLDEVNLQITEYRMRVDRLIDTIKGHNNMSFHDELAELRDSTALILQIDQIERSALFQIWRENKINRAVMTKLTQQLDHRIKHFTG